MNWHQKEKSNTRIIAELLLCLLMILVFQKFFSKYPTVIAIYLVFYALLLTAGFFIYRRAKKISAGKKGLTLQDLNNIRFTKRWGAKRADGMTRFVIIDGVLVAGTLLSIAIGFLLDKIWQVQQINALDSPSTMFKLIGYAYLLGAIAGGLGYRLFWFRNERRFNRLTDPFTILKRIQLEKHL